MSLVTVYAYEVYIPGEDAFVPANVDLFATLETIKNDPGLRVMAHESLQVDSSQINERGRYRRLPSNG
jgi:hypothetical protein